MASLRGRLLARSTRAGCVSNFRAPLPSPATPAAAAADGAAAARAPQHRPRPRALFPFLCSPAMIGALGEVGAAPAAAPPASMAFPRALYSSSSLSSSSDNEQEKEKEKEKERFKGKSWPEMGTATQEGSQGERAAAEEAGYERAHEDAQRLRQAGTVSEALKEGAHIASDVAKGVGEFASKVADMGREAVGRGLETASGLAGTAGAGEQGQEEEEKDKTGKQPGGLGGSSSPATGGVRGGSGDQGPGSGGTLGKRPGKVDL